MWPERSSGGLTRTWNRKYMGRGQGFVARWATMAQFLVV